MPLRTKRKRRDADNRQTNHGGNGRGSGAPAGYLLREKGEPEPGHKAEEPTLEQANHAARAAVTAPTTLPA